MATQLDQASGSDLSLRCVPLVSLLQVRTSKLSPWLQGSVATVLYLLLFLYSQMPTLQNSTRQESLLWFTPVGPLHSEQWWGVHWQGWLLIVLEFTDSEVCSFPKTLSHPLSDRHCGFRGPISMWRVIDFPGPVSSKFSSKLLEGALLVQKSTIPPELFCTHEVGTRIGLELCVIVCQCVSVRVPACLLAFFQGSCVLIKLHYLSVLLGEEKQNIKAQQPTKWWAMCFHMVQLRVLSSEWWVIISPVCSACSSIMSLNAVQQKCLKLSYHWVPKPRAKLS